MLATIFVFSRWRSGRARAHSFWRISFLGTSLDIRTCARTISNYGPDLDPFSSICRNERLSRANARPNALALPDKTRATLENLSYRYVGDFRKGDRDVTSIDELDSRPRRTPGGEINLTQSFRYRE